MKVLLASSIYPDAIEEMRRDHDVVCAFGAPAAELKTRIRDREVAVLRSGVSFSAEVMSCAPDLKLLIRAGSGFDNIDMNHIESHGIELVRVPEPGAKAVAEMAFAMMLALARNLFEADRLWRKGRWAKQEITGYSLTGKTLGVVGAGNIGTRVGRMGVVWGMEVLGCVDPPTEEDGLRLRENGIRMTTFDEVIEKADYLSIHVPLLNTTRNLIDKKALARMKRGAFLINLARGGVVDEKALRAALVNGHIRGAGLDVHEHEGEGKVSPLADLPNVILTPHIGAGTVDSQREIGARVLEILSAFVAGRAKTGAVS
jgi:D-3-phosphoglycerate dehydrogenase